MFNLETLRLIRKTFKRFLSLVLIVLIGSSFMVGLMSTPTIMKKSVDAYFDKHEFQDLQIYSQYGFNADDYRALKKIDIVKNVYPSRTIDVHAVTGSGTDYILRVAELDKTLNSYELIEGRMPENEHECIFIDYGNGNSAIMNENLKLDYGSNDISDYLKNDNFVVVGHFKTPEYMAKVMGTSNLNNKDLEALILVPNSNFIFDYYTTMYLSLEGSADYTSYTDAYDEFVSNAKEELENETYDQQKILRDKMISEAQAELDEKTALFEEMKEKGQKELDDAQQQLTDANVQIAAYEAQLNVLDATIRSLQSAIEANRPLIQEIGSTVSGINDSIISTLDEYGIEVNLHYGAGLLDYLVDTYNDYVGQYNAMHGMIASAKVQYEEGLAEYQEALVRYDKEIKDAELQLRLAQQTLDELPSAQWVFLDRDMQYSALMYKNTCNQMGAIGFSLPFMFYLVAALVCLTTMKRLIDEQRGQIGIYVALGFSDGQIIFKYVSYALMASLIGCLIGIIIGIPIFPNVIYTTWRMMYNLPPIQLSYPPIYVILTIILFTGLMSGVTAYVVREVVKEAPAALMRPKAPKTAKEILLEKIKFIWNALSFTSKITARNLFRYKSRFLMTVIGVAGCTGLLVIGFGVRDSISGVIELQYGEIFRYNYSIYLEDDADVEGNVTKLNKDMDNEFVASMMNYSTMITSETKEAASNLFVVDPRDAVYLFGLRETDKETPIRLSNDGIIVSERFAYNNNIKKGDYVTIESKSGLKAEVKVSNICEMYFMHYAFMSSSVYENIFAEEVSDNLIAVKTSNPNFNPSGLDGVVSISSFNTSITLFQQLVGALNLIIGVIILVAGSLALVVLINLTQVNISERIREIATLKVLGFNNHEINMYIFKEILLLTIIGGIIGLPLGVFEHHIIMNVISMDMAMFGMKIFPLSFIFSFAITLIFTILVLLFMRKPLREVNMVESLKSVE